MAFWSNWFRGEATPPADAQPHVRTVTVAEVSAQTEPPRNVSLDRCLLCEASATVAQRESAIRVDCAVCGRYGASLDAARALAALVKYRAPALSEVRRLLETHRRDEHLGIPTIGVQYVIPGATTFFVHE